MTYEEFLIDLCISKSKELCGFRSLCNQESNQESNQAINQGEMLIDGLYGNLLEFHGYL